MTQGNGTGSGPFSGQRGALRSAGLLAAIALVLALAEPGRAQCSPIPLAPPGAVGGEEWGRAVAASNDLFVIGGPGASGANGQVSVYRSLPMGGGWMEEQRFGGLTAGSRFGAAVAADVDRVAVGAPADKNLGGTDTGVVYVFRHQGLGVWIQEAKIEPAGGASLDQFGTSVSVFANTLVVGAPGNDQVGLDAGAVYVFEESFGLWSQTAVLSPTVVQAGELFGQSVSLDLDTVLIGAPQRTGLGGSGSGGAFVFRRTGPVWLQEAFLEAPDATALDAFGTSVALSQDAVLIGASEQNGSRGAAYVFRFAGPLWVPEQKLLPAVLTPGNRFGAAVGLDGDTAVVGVPGDDGGGVDAGAIEVFRKGTAGWVPGLRRQATAIAPATNFGTSLALSDHSLVVGEPLRDGGPVIDSGRAYAIDLAVAGSTFYGTGWAGTLGVPTISLQNPPVYNTTITVDITNSRGANTLAAVFYGLAETSIPAFGGELLVVPAIVRVIILPAAGISIPFPLGACTTLTSFNRSYSFVQVIQQDPGGASGYSGSPGTQICPSQEAPPP